MERKIVVGIDVSKARLNVAFRPSGKRLIVSNGTRGISRLTRALKSAGPERVLLEATGG
jgi:transposase